MLVLHAARDAQITIVGLPTDFLISLHQVDCNGMEMTLAQCPVDDTALCLTPGAGVICPLADETTPPMATTVISTSSPPQITQTTESVHLTTSLAEATTDRVTSTSATPPQVADTTDSTTLAETTDKSAVSTTPPQVADTTDSINVTTQAEMTTDMITSIGYTTPSQVPHTTDSMQAETISDRITSRSTASLSTTSSVTNFRETTETSEAATPTIPERTDLVFNATMAAGSGESGTQQIQESHYLLALALLLIIIYNR